MASLDVALIDIENQVELYRAMMVGNVQKPLVYSHRNGETDAPTVAGRYWFKGKIHHQDYSHDVAGLKEVMEHWKHEGHENWLLVSEEFEHRLNDAEGQWWGPVLAPWEEQDTERK